MVLYSVTAFVVLFFVDRIAGGFFAIVSALLIAGLLGYIETKTQVIASEAILVLGMFASAYVGPTGGLLDPLLGARSDNSAAVAARHYASLDEVDKDSL